MRHRGSAIAGGATQLPPPSTPAHVAPPPPPRQPTQGRFWRDSFGELGMPAEATDLFTFEDGYPKVFDERTPADENGTVSWEVCPCARVWLFFWWWWWWWVGGGGGGGVAQGGDVRAPADGNDGTVELGGVLLRRTKRTCTRCCFGKGTGQGGRELAGAWLSGARGNPSSRRLRSLLTCGYILHLRPCVLPAARHRRQLCQDQLAEGRHPGLRQAADRLPQLRHRDRLRPCVSARPAGVPARRAAAHALQCMRMPHTQVAGDTVGRAVPGHCKRVAPPTACPGHPLLRPSFPSALAACSLGVELDKWVRSKGVEGIVNGMDVEEWSPALVRALLLGGQDRACLGVAGWEAGAAAASAAARGLVLAARVHGMHL